MATNKGLGKGLGSLLGILERDEDLVSVEKPLDGGEKKAGVEMIDLGLIDNNPNQPRKNFDANALNELAESIRQHGVIQPVILTKKGARYLIVAGERRFRACKIAGLKQIPAVVRDYSPQEVKEIALLENIQREDLNPIECARALQELLHEYNWTQEVLADRLGKSRPSIANTLRLLSLSPQVVEMVQNGKLSAGHARSLVVVTDPEIQYKLAQMATTKKVTVRDLEKAVKESLNPKKPNNPTKKEKSLELKDLEDRLKRTFGTKVEIKGTDKKGKIIITYVSRDDLDRIYDLTK